MKAAALLFLLSLALLAAPNAAWARDAVLPAGTLLHCTLDEPNFSSATASVGDPVLCYPHGLQVFGQSVLPRGSYIVGHLAADKDPGHFWGKGYLKIEFDRIGLPSADLPLEAKIIAVSGGYRVDREGKIIGKGHAKRDVVEWMLPPLWPWKVLTLPARGPRPTLKGETRVTMRLMDDVLIPDSAGYRRFGRVTTGDTYGHPALYIRPQRTLTPPLSLTEPVYRTISWQAQSGAAAPQVATAPPQAEYHSSAAEHAGFRHFGKGPAPPAAPATAAPPPMSAAPDADNSPEPARAPVMNNADAADNSNSSDAAPAENTAATPAIAAPVKPKPVIQEQDMPPANAKAPAAPAPQVVPVSTADSPALAKTLSIESSPAAASGTAPAQKAKLTLIAVKAGNIYAVTDYWRDEDRLGYVLSNGKEGEVDLSELDWKVTSQLNGERNVKFTLREGK